jgi:hypothetical protein
MTAGRGAIARVALARSLPRLLALPFLLFALAGGAIAGGLIVVPPPAGFALVGVGAVVAMIGLALMVMVLSIRLEVEEAAIRVSWIGGARSFTLSPGPVTRVRLRGPNASRVRVRSGPFGWGLGRAVLRGEESIQIVRLAPTRTAILVPTDRGRLAIAPARDEELLNALSRAARARQRLEAEAAVAVAQPEAEPDAAAVAPGVVEAPPDIEARDVTEPEIETRPLTGIERAMLEARLAEEDRAAAEVGAAELPAAEVDEAGAPPPVDDATPVAAKPVATAAPRPWRAALRRLGTRAAFVVLPLVGAGLAWLAGVATGRMPEAGSDLARLTSLALVMAGPATSVGAVMAMAWWPRLVGVVVTGGLVASVFIGRSLIAP